MYKHHNIYKGWYQYVYMDKLISIRLDDDAWNFCKQNNIQFSALLREAIFNRKQVIEGVVVDNLHEERRKREEIQKKLYDAVEFINKKNLVEEYMTL